VADPPFVTSRSADDPPGQSRGSIEVSRFSRGTPAFRRRARSHPDRPQGPNSRSCMGTCSERPGLATAHETHDCESSSSTEHSAVRESCARTLGTRAGTVTCRWLPAGVACSRSPRVGPNRTEPRSPRPCVDPLGVVQPLPTLAWGCWFDVFLSRWRVAAPLELSDGQLCR
jgi:hypothetical protein